MMACAFFIALALFACEQAWAPHRARNEGPHGRQPAARENLRPLLRRSGYLRIGRAVHLFGNPHLDSSATVGDESHA